MFRTGAKIYLREKNLGVRCTLRSQWVKYNRVRVNHCDEVVLMNAVNIQIIETWNRWLYGGQKTSKLWEESLKKKI